MKLSKKTLKKRDVRRGSIKGTKEIPRLSVFRSNTHFYAQIIDDSNFSTLVSCSTLDIELRELINNSKTCLAAALVGQKLTERCLQKNIKKIIFDRGPYIYHGRVKAFAESARKNGLEF
jgi:large subunit ribosomal protein L18